MLTRIAAIIGLCLGAGAALAQDASGLARYEAGGFRDPMFGAPKLELTLSQGVPWRVFTLTDPWRVVMDFREVDWTAASPDVLDQSDHIVDLRTGRFQPGWSRMVAQLSEPLAVTDPQLRIDGTTGQARLSFTLEPVDAQRFSATAGAPPQAGWAAPARAVQKAPPARPDNAPLLIMLDPGHGGIDPGAERDGQNEAQLMLQFALELRDVLLRTGRFQVALTRDSDTFVSLEKRVALAHELGADLFISLHADALDEGVAHGASVYTLAEDASDAASAALAERHDRDDLLAGLDLSGADDRIAEVLMQIARLDNTPRSVALAEDIVDGIRGALDHVHKRPLRQAGFSVLKAADIPSVLIELGFLSSKTDRQNLQDPLWRAGMAAGIRDGIETWVLEDAALARLRRQ